MMGVEYDLFWTLNPKSLSPFVKAFNLQQKYDDWLAWQNGLYVKMAIGSSLSKDNKYPELPLLEERKKPTVPKVNLMKEVMMERMMIINSRFSEEELVGE